jgi:Predicted ABC-type transport system involved in lysophospholipase L1 biosynthesis, permease component
VFKVTLRGLFAHKLRFFLTAIAVVLGVAFVSGTLVFTDTVKKTFDQLFSSVYDGTDAFVRSSSVLKGDFGPEQRQRIPEQLVQQVRGVPDVSAAEGQIRVQRAQFLDRKGKAIGDPGQGAPTLGFNWNRVARLNPFTLVPFRGVRSRAPTAAHEVVMDLGTAKDAGYKIGDTVTISFNNRQVPEDKFRIVGVSKFGDADRPAGATVALFTLPETQRVNGSPGQLDGVVVAARPGVSQPRLVAQIKSTINERGIQVITGAKLIKEQRNQIEKNLGFFTTFLLIFALIALFVGSFIIVNTFSIVIAQRTRELALLRALGASGRQVRGSVLGEALLVGLLSSVVGVGLGLALAVGLRAVMGAFGFEVPTADLVIKSSTFVISIALGVVVTFVAALFPARRAARIAPIAALQAAATESRQLGRRTVIGVVIALLGAIVLLIGLFANGGIQLVGFGVFGLFIGVAVLGPVIARPVGRLLGAPLPRWRGMPGTLARENAVRNPRRTASTAAALMIGVALVVLITIFASSLKQSIGGQIDTAFRGDLVVLGGNGPGSSFSPAMAERIAKVPGVAVANPLRFGGFEVKGNGQFLLASRPGELDRVFDLAPKAGDLKTLGPNQIAVSQKVFDDNHWKLGQRVRTRFPVSGAPPLTIGAVFGRGQREGLADYFISLAAYDRRFTEIADSQVYIALDRGASIAEVRPRIERIAKEFPGAKVNDVSGLKDQFEAQINQILGLIFALLFLAIFIALLGIMNTLLLSIVERTREIGLLRAVGMTRKQVRTSVRWESIIVAVFGALLGLVLGIFFGWAMVTALHDQGFTEFVVPGSQLVLVVVLAALAGVLAAAYPARRASHFDVLEAISTE